MEQEAKWEPTTPLTVATVEAIDWQPYRLGERQLLRQINEYYDTPDHALRQARYGLRLRNENDQLIVTLKHSGTVNNGLHERAEEEARVESADPADWPPAITELVAPLIGNQPLASFLRIENGRQAWLVLLDNQVIGELALDSGTIFAGERRGSLHELEWELKGGSPEQFATVRTLIETQLPLQPSDISKLQRGIALLDHDQSAENMVLTGD